MWLTGAASQSLAAILGSTDGCCGSDNDGGCGKCLLIQNPDAVNSDWAAVVMKKNQCPPWSNGCEVGKMHFDIAVPGFDNLQFSTANICGNPLTGFPSKQSSAALGSWYNQCQDTSKCAHLCDKLPTQFQAGCKLFASWGWKSGDPKNAKFKSVVCPPAFVAHVTSVFGTAGPNNLQLAPKPLPANPTPEAPAATPAPTQLVTSKPLSKACVGTWEACTESKCCSSPGDTCVAQNQWYSQCRPPPTISSPTAPSSATSTAPDKGMTGCAGTWDACTESKCCSAPGDTCVVQNQWYAQCKPSSAT